MCEIVLNAPQKVLWRMINSENKGKRVPKSALYHAGISLFRAYILEIMIVIFGMEMDTTMNFFGTLRKFHDDNSSLFLHIFLYFFGGNDTGNDGQTFLLAGNVKSCTGTCCNEGGDTGNVLHRNIVGL